MTEDKVEEDQLIKPMALPSSSESAFQFGKIDIVILLVGSCLWLGASIIQAAVQGPGLVIAYGIALGAGTSGYIAYTMILPWRGVVVIISLVFYTAIATLLFAVAGSLSLIEIIKFHSMIFTAPVTQLFAPSPLLSPWQLLPCWVATLILLPVQWIRPGIAGSLVTAMGAMIWFNTGLIVSIGAFFGA